MKRRCNREKMQAMKRRCNNERCNEYNVQEREGEMKRRCNEEKIQ